MHKAMFIGITLLLSLIHISAMKLREALDTYMFDNVGQFGGIAESLGYQTEYRDEMCIRDSYTAINRYLEARRKKYG